MANRRSTSSAHIRRTSSATRRASRRADRQLHSPTSSKGLGNAGASRKNSHGSRGVAGAQISNVAGLGSGGGAGVGSGLASGGKRPARSGRVRSRTGSHSRASSRKQQSLSSGLGSVSVAPTPRHGDKSGGGIGGGSGFGGGAGGNGGPAITRRHLIIGAVGVGAVAALGGGAYALTQRNADSDEVVTLEVPESAVSSSNDLGDAQPADEHMTLSGSYDLPYGTLLWSSDDQVAACLIPSETANPLCQVGVLWLGSGTLTTLLETSQGSAEGFQIYDVRATTHGVIWVEADILENAWRVYTASLSEQAVLGKAVLAEEGGGDWETPSIAAVGDAAYWQLMPKPDSDASTEDSQLKTVAFGGSDPQVVWTSHGRFATPPYACADALVITPRVDTSGVYYQLTRLDCASHNATDTLILPRNMTPLEAGYGNTGFMFSFDAIYDYGGGIANLGTYCPTQDTQGGNYSDASWFRFARTPSAAPAWCGNYLAVKSTTSVCGVDLSSSTWFTLGMEDGSDDYGDYLATSGSGELIVTYANIDHTPLSGEHTHCCRVRVWRPL